MEARSPCFEAKGSNADWKTDLMREVGAVLGLAVGYVIKYTLDRRFVFREPGAIGR